MSIILVNNRDRKEYKIRTYPGIIGRSINLKKHADSTRFDANAEGIIPFRYIDKNGTVQESNGCVSGAFMFGGELVKPLPGKWCASEVDVDGNMTEWGYCIDLTNEIKTLDDAIQTVKDFVDSYKSNSFIIGWLKTYTLDKKDLLKEIKVNPEILELLRNKEKFPDINLYKIGDEVKVRDVKYILEDNLELGKRWVIKPGEGKVLVKPSELKTVKVKQEVVPEEKWYGTNKDQSHQKIVHTYQGIIHKDYNLARRGKERRQEKTKECIFPFDYINKNNKRVSSTSCVSNNMKIEGYELRYPGDPWCATEVDDTGLMREWGFCTKEQIEVPIEEKEVWMKLCKSIKFEQWSETSIIIRELLREGYSERNIFNMIFEVCNKKTIAPYFETLKTIVNSEYIKLYPWILKHIEEKPNLELFKPKDNLNEIVLSKLKYLEKVFNLDLTNGLISNDSIWLIYYYYVVERIIIDGILSPSGDVKVKLIQKAKIIQDKKVLNNALLNLERSIKGHIKQNIESIDKTGVSVNFNNRPSELNNDINQNLIIINYGVFFENVEREKRVLYYDLLDLDLDKSNIPEQLMFYNKSFVEPIEKLVKEIEYPEIISEGEEEYGEEEKRTTRWKNSNIEFYSNYPEVNDPQFFLKIQRKQEFKINKMESWKDKKIEDLCRIDTFELSAQQEWISNFFNPETPYRGLLLWWGTGVGKTCASITIAEKHLDYYKKYNKRILVILGTSTLENYKKELYNFKKEKIEIANGLTPGTLQCTKNRYYIPIDSNNPALLKKREQKILKRIEQDYEFITYGSLKGILTKLLQRRGIKLEYEGEKSIEPKRKPKEVGEEIKIGDVTFVATKTIKGFLVWKKLLVVDEIKEKRIKLAISEYFSNRLIIVDEIQNIRTAGEGGDAIAPQMLEKIIHYSEDIKLVMMSATPMFNNATEIVYILNLLLENDKREKIKPNSIFDAKGNLTNERLLENICRGYISYVRGANPISFPLKLLPNRSPIEFIRDNNEIYYPRPLTKMDGTEFLEDEYIRYNSLVKCDMSPYQEAIFRRVVLGEDDIEGNKGDNTNETFDIKGKVISNIVYPTVDKKDINKLYGETGFNNCFIEENSMYTYSEDAILDGKPFLDYDKIEKYSCKFKKILDNILHTQNGIIFVYSEYRKGGSIPLALTLEQNGFEQLVVEGKYGEGVIKNKLNSPYKRKRIPNLIGASSSPKWRYVLLDGDLDPKKRAQILEKCNSSENQNGDLIKVVIGTRVAGEGVDFARIRQVHILNPWDNMSRIDQIIGRGIRNCSHKDLAEEERNVTVFLYGAHIRDNSVETTDEKIHRRAEKKDIQMKQVEIVMRNNSIDCVSNYLANRYTIEDFGDVIGDKDGARECAYGNCDEVFMCKDSDRIRANVELDLDTYNLESHANRETNKYKQYIKELYGKSVIYSLDQIKEYLQKKLTIKKPVINPKAPAELIEERSNFDNDIFLVALDKLISNKESIQDKYKRNGTLVFRNTYYVFQPDDLSKTENLPLYYRETPLTVKENKVEIDLSRKLIEQSKIKEWVIEVKNKILEIDDIDELAYELDRVKDIVMKEIILEWFNGNYDASLIENSEIQDKLFEYFENRDVFIMDEDKENIIAIYWNNDITFEYLVDTKELREHVQSEIFKPKTQVYNFNDYPFERHVIGRIEKLSDGKDDSYEHEVAFKIIDFSFLEDRSNLRLDGKSCMSYNKGPLSKILSNLGFEEDIDLKRKDICRIIELKLRENHREREEGRIWWIESSLPFVLEK